MSEERFNRLETKVDKVDEKVNELKVEMVEMKSDMKHHMDVVEAHVAGDNKIIDHLQPILGDLADLVQDKKYQEENTKRKINKWKTWSLKVGLVSLLIGMGAGLAKIFSAF